MRKNHFSRINQFLLLFTILTIASCDDGIDGFTSLVNIENELSGENCSNGGYRLETGIDSNKNGILESTEIQQTEFICNGMNGTTIYQLRFKVFSGVYASTSTPFIHTGDAIKFDITNYPGVDSAIFVVEHARSSASHSDIVFELFDLTNGVGITGSEVRTNSTVKTRILSDNIFSFLPQSEVDLGLRIRTEVDGTYGEAESVYLFLYYRK